VLKSGTTEASVEGVGVVKRYEAGGFFGELALMADSGKRAASITVSSDSDLGEDRIRDTRLQYDTLNFTLLSYQVTNLTSVQICEHTLPVCH
jgi:CRP-like cAMP-binding protein